MEENELYDLKYNISEYILPRLKAFKDILDRGEMVSLPTFDRDESVMVDYKGIKDQSDLWGQILEDMIFPFDYHCNPEKFDELENGELKTRMKRGLTIFGRFFEDLWI